MKENDSKFNVLGFIFICVFIPIGYTVFFIQNTFEFIRAVFDWYEFKESLRSTGEWLICARIKIYKLTHGK